MYCFLFFFPGLGYTTQVIVALLNIYYIIVLAWAIFYLSNCFTWDLPWASCNNTWNTGGKRHQHILHISPRRRCSVSCTSPSHFQSKHVFMVVTWKPSRKPRILCKTERLSTLLSPQPLYFIQDSCREFQRGNSSINLHENATSPVTEFWE